MATQGLVTLKRGEVVLMKIVVGDNGMKAGVLAKAIQMLMANTGSLPSSKEAYQMAERTHFGCPACLVVVTESDMTCLFTQDPGPLYRSTFTQPRFNPRWESGLCEHVRVIDTTRLLKSSSVA